MCSRRGRVFVLFRSGLGLVFFAAFLSLGAQLRDLAGSRGLLPWPDFLARLHQGGAGGLRDFLLLPTLFLWIRGDAALTIVPLLGAAIALLLLLGLGGRLATAALWLLYLSCITAGRDFFYYQWDNLLLETSFLAIFLPGRGSLFDLARGRPVPEPPPVVVFLLKWILCGCPDAAVLLLLPAGRLKLEHVGDAEPEVFDLDLEELAVRRVAVVVLEQ